MSSPPLTSLGRYRIVRTLARGAMGVVYEAVDARLGRTVAIKTVLKAHLDDEATAHQFALRFEREAQAAARMSHPNIVTVYDFGEHDGELSYIVMEFVRGRELASLFKGGQAFTLAESARIIGQLLDALAYAHERGVVHRDVKPANVLIDEAGQVKLADFGVARLAEGTLERTMPGTIVGTPNYMAPEQILGQAVGSRADLFAAGVLLYQCLTGVQPFSGGGMFEVQRRILQDEPPPPSTLRPEMPAAMDEVVARALAKQPDARYDSAARFAAELRRVAGAAAPGAGAAGAATDDDATVLLTMPTPGAWDPTLQQAPTAPAAASTRPPSQPGAAPALAGTGPSRPGTWPSQTGATPSLPGTTPSQPGRRPSVPGAATAGAATWPSAAEDGGRATATAAATAPPVPASQRTTSPALLALLALGAAGAAVAWWALGPQEAATGDSPPAVTAPTPAPAPPPPVVVAPPPSPTPAPVETAPPPTVDTAPAPVTSAPAPPSVTPMTPEPTVPEPAAAPAPGPRPPAARAAPSTSPRPAPPRAAAPAPAPAGRCAELLERMQLGEPLTPEQSTYFQSRCTR